MRIKVESDGTIKGTFITNVETGEQLEHVRGIDIFINVGEPVTVKMTLFDVELDITGEVDDTITI